MKRIKIIRANIPNGCIFPKDLFKAFFPLVLIFWQETKRKFHVIYSLPSLCGEIGFKEKTADNIRSSYL